jgi:hypothetical protein
MPTISRINVTPVKGMAQNHPSEAELGKIGIPGNRLFHLVNDFGELFSVGDHGPLVRVGASYDPDEDRLTLRFPGGTEVSGDAGQLGDPTQTSFHGRIVAGHELEGEWSEAVSAFVGKRLRLIRNDREGDGPDVRRLTLVSLASVRALADGAGHDGDLDSRRFRINLELEGCKPYEEDTWEGRRVRVGEALVRMFGQIPRCKVTNLDPDTGERDFSTLTAIARQRPRVQGAGLPFGMYAEVEQPGRARVGDPVEPLGD